MKRLLLSVSCANYDACDFPESFYVELSNSEIQEIKRLSKVVIDNEAYSMDKIYHAGQWSEKYLDLSQMNGDGVQLDEVVKEVKNQSIRVDVPMLNVTEDSLYFSAYPRGAGDDLMLSTPPVNLVELDDPEILVSL